MSALPENVVSENMGSEMARRVTALPMGCYYATQSREDTDYRLLLRKILAHDVTPPLSSFSDAEQSNLQKMTQAGLITLDEPQTSLPLGNLGHLMQYALPALSPQRRVVLSETRHALVLGFTGFEEARAEELAVLAAQVQSIEEVHGNLKRPVSLHNHAIGLIDPVGGSDLGFWSVHVADKVFSLTISGTPRFNSDQFALLVWGLVERYGVQEDL